MGTYTKSSTNRAARPRSERLRESGGVIVSTSTSVVGGNNYIPSGNTHTHANLDALNMIAVDDGYIYLTDTYTDETTQEQVTETVKVKAGYADKAAANADGYTLDWFIPVTVNGVLTLKLNPAYAGLWAEGWISAGGVGTGGGGGGGGASFLSELGDVSLGTLGNGNLLAWNGSSWTNIDQSAVRPDLTGYATQSWVTGQGYIANESDPVFSASAASGITAANIASWNSKTSNTGTVTSVTLTSGTGITVSNSGTAITTSGSRTISISSAYRTYIDHGETAYGWGNHATQGYLKASDLAGYATQSWANNRFLLKTGGDINGDIFHEIEEAEEGSDEIIVDERWRITENGEAAFASLTVGGIDFSTIDYRVSTLWNARNNYLPLTGGTMTGSILTSADSTNNIGASGTRFLSGHIRNIYTTYFAFMSDDGLTQRGNIGMGSGYASINLIGTPTVSYNFFADAGFFHSGDGAAPCGRSDHRWSKVWTEDADISGGLVIGGDIVPSADLGSQLGDSSRRFSNINVRTVGSVKEINFKSGDNATATGYLTFQSGYMALRAGTNIDSTYKQITFHESYGFYPEQAGVNLGFGSASQYRWATIYGVNADLSGDLALAQTSHIDIGPLRIEYDATNKALHITKKDSTDTETYGLYADGFLAAGGVQQNA